MRLVGYRGPKSSLSSGTLEYACTIEYQRIMIRQVISPQIFDPCWLINKGRSFRNQTGVDHNTRSSESMKSRGSYARVSGQETLKRFVYLPVSPGTITLKSSPNPARIRSSGPTNPQLRFSRNVTATIVSTIPPRIEPRTGRVSRPPASL